MRADKRLAVCCQSVQYGINQAVISCEIAVDVQTVNTELVQETQHFFADCIALFLGLEASCFVIGFHPMNKHVDAVIVIEDFGNQFVELFTQHVVVVVIERREQDR